MARPRRTDFEGAVHHVYDRGNVGQAIFRDDRDRQSFLQRVARYQEECRITMLGHCLMTTHFHLVPQTGPTPLEEFMHRLLTSYTRHFNDRWLMRGHLFQGRYGGRRCKTDEEVRAAIRYTHMNPVKDGLVGKLEDWPWSSHRGYLSGRDAITNVSAGLAYFGGRGPYLEHLSAPLAKDERPSLGEIAKTIAGEEGVRLMRSSSKSPSAADLRRELIVLGRLHGYRCGEIAKYLGCGPSSVSMLLKRAQDVKLRA